MTTNGKPGVLWCSDSRRNRGLGWRFPVEVNELLREFVATRSCLHLFGGKATWGLRLDIDPLVHPNVVGDAWLPPFSAGAFDVVVLDPPYDRLNGELRRQMLCVATHLARAHVVWFHTLWIEPGWGLRRERSWLVRVGRSSAVRCLIIFVRGPRAVEPPSSFKRGPAIRYNRWLEQPAGLPFPADSEVRRR